MNVIKRHSAFKKVFFVLLTYLVLVGVTEFFILGHFGLDVSQDSNSKLATTIVQTLLAILCSLVIIRIIKRFELEKLYYVTVIAVWSFYYFVFLKSILHWYL